MTMFSWFNCATSAKCTIWFLMAISTIDSTSSIVVPEKADLFSITNGSRDLINAKDREDFDDIRELRRTIPCMKKFVDRFFNLQPSRLPVLLPENVSDTWEFARMYLSVLQQNASTYILSGNFSAESEQVNTLNGVIMFEDYDEFLTMQSKLINVCGRDCKYLILLTRTFSSKESFLAECSKLIPVLWQQRVANVVFLSAVDHTVLVARSLKFKFYSDCEPDEPVIVGECDEDSNWDTTKWYSIKEMYLPLEMNKCLMTVAFFDYEPYVTGENVTITDDINNFDNATNATTTVLLRGIEGLIMNTLSMSLNFIILAEEIPWLNDTDLSIQVDEALWATDVIDVVIGGLPWGERGETVYTLPYDVVQTIWLAPIVPNVSLQGLISPLHEYVWFGVIGILVFAFCMEFIVTRNVSFLETFSLVIGIAWPRQPKILSSRIRFMSWVIFGFLMTQFYLASLAGQLMASTGMYIDTLADLAESNFQIGGPSEIAKLFETDENADEAEEFEDNEINRIINGRYETLAHDEYNEALNDLIEEKNDKMVIAVRMNISSMKPSFEGRHVHRMKEAVASYPLSFATWRGMPHLTVFDKKISSLIEGGIISYWAQLISHKDGGYSGNSHDEGNYLNLRSLVPGFLLLIMGYGLAIIAFLMEIAVHKWQNRRGARVKIVKSRVTNKKTAQIKTLPVIKIDRKIGQKLPDVTDTKAWIEFLNSRRQHRTPIKRQVEPKVRKSPFEFVL